MGSYNGPAGGDLSGLNVDANLDMGAYDLLTDDIKESTGAHGVDIDGVEVKDSEIVTPDVINETAYLKVASDNNRHAHSYDGNRAPDASVYAKVAGMVFAKGIKGTLRVETDISSSNAVSAFCEIKYMLNSVQKGIVKQSSLEHPSYDTVTQDIALDIAAGGELELWMKCLNDVHTVYAKNWKIDYDNAADGIAVDMAEA
jgi:hypothetical protein